MTVDWTHFTPGSALAGGLLIGLSAAWLILFDGRVLGAAGVLGGLVPPRAGDWAWRASLLAGLAASPFAAQLFFAPARPTIEADAATLVRELQNFQVKLTAAANETFGVWREGQHDDLVLAVALACWWAERNPPLGENAFGGGGESLLANPPEGVFLT